MQTPQHARCYRTKEFTVTTIAERAPLTPSKIDAVVQAQLDDRATDDQLRYLESDTGAWAASLWRLLDAAEFNLASARRDVRGGARAAVLNDLDEECFRIDAALTALIGEPAEDELVPVSEPEAPDDVPVVRSTSTLPDDST